MKKLLSLEADLKPIMELKPEPEQTEFYVLDRKLEVVEQPEIDGLITDYLYKGEKVEVLEKQGEWARISDYIVLKEGGPQTAEWVSMSGLSDDEVIISEKESIEILIHIWLGNPTILRSIKRSSVRRLQS